MNQKISHPIIETLLWAGVAFAVMYASIVETDSFVIRMTSAAALTLAGYWTIRAVRDRHEAYEKQKEIEYEASDAKFQKDRWHAFIELSHDGIIILDKNNRILKINQAVCDVSGYSMDETVGKPCAEVFQCDKYKEAGITFGLAFLTEEHPSYYEEVTIHTKDGNQIDVGVRCARAKKHPGHRGTHLILMRDLTKIHQAESLEHDFVSMTSHQLFTPLSIIRGHISMVLSGDLGKINDKQKNFLDQSLLSTKRMVHLVTELLSISRLEEQKITLNLAPTDITKLVDTVSSELEPLAKTKSIHVTFNKPKTDIPTLSMDAEKMSQVLQNLLDNGIKYSEEGGHIDISLSVRAHDVMLSVSDNGIGVPRTDINKLFQRFYRSANAVSRDSKGTGLGLYIARVIVERHHGKIWVESTEGEGSTFFITLPK